MLKVLKICCESITKRSNLVLLWTVPEKTRIRSVCVSNRFFTSGNDSTFVNILLQKKLKLALLKVPFTTQQKSIGHQCFKVTIFAGLGGIRVMKVFQLVLYYNVLLFHQFSSLSRILVSSRSAISAVFTLTSIVTGPFSIPGIAGFGTQMN